MRKLLVLTSRFPYPPIGGEKVRIFNLVKHLSADFDVELCALYSGEGEIKGADAMLEFCRRVHLVRLPRLRRVFNALAGLFKSRPFQVSYYHDRRAADEIGRIIRDGRFDGLVVHLIRMLEYSKGFPREKTVVELTDAISMNYARIGWPGNLREAIYLAERRRVLRYEMAVPGRAHSAVLVSETDKSYLETHGYPGGRLLVVKNGTRMKMAADPGYDRDRIAFIGNMRSTQNEDMCLHFIKDILPLVLARRPGAKFVVIGANPSRRLRAMHDGESVHVLGEVDDVEAHARPACMTVCPMRYGAGIQNKILESMAMGIPVVTTGIGQEGIGGRSGKELLVADDPADFAACVIRLMEEPGTRDRISRLGADYIDREFRWEKRVGPFLELVRDITAPGREGDPAEGRGRPVGRKAEAG